jgi:hypothetical protein
MLPDAQKDLLRHVFRLSLICEHPPCETDHARKVTANEFGRGALVAGADPTHQFLVRISHGLEADSENRSAWPKGQFIKAALFSTLCILPRRLPSHSLLICGAVSARRGYSCARSIERAEGVIPS